MEELSEALAAADPFQSWIPIVVAVVVGVGITIQ